MKTVKSREFVRNFAKYKGAECIVVGRDWEMMWVSSIGEVSVPSCWIEPKKNEVASLTMTDSEEVIVVNMEDKSSNQKKK